MLITRLVYTQVSRCQWDVEDILHKCIDEKVYHHTYVNSYVVVSPIRQKINTELYTQLQSCIRDQLVYTVEDETYERFQI